MIIFIGLANYLFYEEGAFRSKEVEAPGGTVESRITMNANGIQLESGLNGSQIRIAKDNTISVIGKGDIKLEATGDILLKVGGTKVEWDGSKFIDTKKNFTHPVVKISRK